jgi:hypothetical protein
MTPEEIKLLAGGMANDAMYEILEERLALTDDDLGTLVREAWVAWAKAQPDPKPSWLVPYHELPEPDRQADRHIGYTLKRYILAILVMKGTR